MSPLLPEPEVASFLAYPCTFCESPLTPVDVTAAFANIKRLNAKILEENREAQEEDADFVPLKLISNPQPRAINCRRPKCVKAQQARIKDSLAKTAAPEDAPSEIEPTEEELAAIADAEGKKTTKKRREDLVDGMRRDKAEDPDEADLFGGRRNETAEHQSISTYELGDLPKLAQIRLREGQATDSRGNPVPASGSFTPPKIDRTPAPAPPRTITKQRKRAEEIPEVKGVPTPPPIDHLEELRKEAARLSLKKGRDTYKVIGISGCKAVCVQSPKLPEKRERRRKVEPKKISNLRKLHNYETRDLAALLDKQGFDKRVLRTNYDLLTSDERIPGRKLKWRNVHAEIMAGTRKEPPRTMEELINLLPMVPIPKFSDAQVIFYHRYAARNDFEDILKQEAIQKKIAGFEDFISGASSFEDCIIRLENEIIKRAWWLRLLIPKEGVSQNEEASDVHDQARDHDDKLQGQSIDKSGAAGMQVLAGKRRTTGNTYGRYGLSSFNGPTKHRPRDGSDLGSESDPRTPEYDDYGDESGS